MSVDDLYDFLRKTLDIDVVARETIEDFRINRINGESFLTLTDTELLEIVPVLGERKAVRRLIDSFSRKDSQLLSLSNSPVSYNCQF